MNGTGTANFTGTTTGTEQNDSALSRSRQENGEDHCYRYCDCSRDCNIVDIGFLAGSGMIYQRTCVRTYLFKMREFSTSQKGCEGIE